MKPKSPREITAGVICDWLADDSQDGRADHEATELEAMREEQ